MARRVRLALVGLGNVNRAFLSLLVDKAPLLSARYGVEFVVVAAADSSGAVLAPAGADLVALRLHKADGRPLAEYPGGVPGMPAPDLVTAAEADLLLEAAAVNLKNGQPGLDCVRTALRRGMAVVLADKGPLVHAFDELQRAATAAGAGFAFSATVCGALPVVNIGGRDLVACDIRQVRGVFNSTSNSILTAMGQGGSYSAALRQAQLEGVAEADPSLDVGGWDTANKLVIIANSVLGQPTTLADVESVVGITDITTEQIAKHAARGEVVKLVAHAVQMDGRYRLSVGPEWLSAGDFVAGISGHEMGIVIETDIMGVQYFKVDERGPVPTAAAMLRDVINLTKA